LQQIALVSGYQVITSGGSQALTPEGWGGSQRQAFSSVKTLILAAGPLWPANCLEAERPDTNQPDTRKVGE